MTTRMLIDARHPEETRVAVVRNDRIEEFDFEASDRKQIKGNIYLAKITRVEPSLQAAFVDYGGNRHGFLAFSEIHPDYYQIPREDREALLKEEQRLAEENGTAEAGQAEAPANGADGTAADEPAEHAPAEDAAAEALRRRRMQLRRRYKIQDVIKRRQVMLVQVVKEERGTKGAALTTYISLAGRYGVLMPNTPQGGGISRKIANAADRKRLKSVIADLKLPPSMGAIIRTAGLQRTKAEIRRDFDYLIRLWDEIREKTLASIAPCLIYEDNDLIKRAIRDIYTRDVEQVLVDGEAGYRQARAYMKLLMPSHARRVQLYDEPVPLFLKAGVEGQLAAMMNPVVPLKSGGTMVISPTEALVAVDVNSGRATREHNIEETALKTNLEAAEELARQLRLRDMAGLIVVDFIDMEQPANNRRVEKALKEALKADRARVQMGRISSFGLLEMSRQRLRTGVLEASSRTCPQCGGSGLVRTEASAALAALRLVEEQAVKGQASQFRLRADPAVALFVLNRKRPQLADLETRYGIEIDVVPDAELTGARFAIDASGPAPARDAGPAPARETLAEAGAEDGKGPVAGASGTPESTAAAEEGDEKRGRRKRRRRGGRKRKGAAPAPTSVEAGVEGVAAAEEAADGVEEAERHLEPLAGATPSDKTGLAAESGGGEPAGAEPAGGEPASSEPPARRRRGRSAPLDGPVLAEAPAEAGPPPASPRPDAGEASATTVVDDAPPTAEPAPTRRRGWWQRTFGG